MRNRRYGELARALARVIAVARQVLADLAGQDPDDVPQRLKLVAAQTRPRLVPPLERRLLDEIDANEWFRERVAEAFEETEGAEGVPQQAAELFLIRPDGWEESLDSIVRGSEESERSDRETEMTRRLSKLQGDLEKWRNRAKRYRREADEAAAEADRARAAEAHAAGRLRSSSDRLEVEARARENRRLKKELKEVTGERDEARRRLADTRSELARRRRIERPVEHRPAAGAWAALNPLGTARLLDEVAEALSPAPSFAAPMATPVECRSLSLPRGTAPDDRTAIEWLLTVDRDFDLLVDGYNVGFHLDPAKFNTPQVRRRIVNDLARWRALARGRPRIRIVYDSAQTGGTTSDFVAGGIEVSFTTAGHTADDELVDLAGRLGGSAVVVSSDRVVREQAQEAGSLGLWSEALAGWMLHG